MSCLTAQKQNQKNENDIHWGNLLAMDSPQIKFCARQKGVVGGVSVGGGGGRRGGVDGGEFGGGADCSCQQTRRWGLVSRFVAEKGWGWGVGG